MKIFNSFFNPKIIIGLTIALLFLSEVLVWTTGKFGLLGIVAWSITYLIITAYAIYSLALLVRKSLQAKSFFTLVILLAVASLMIFQAVRGTNLSLETPQEIGCMINHLENTSGLGYRQLCFLGYPARQFFIPALPSLLLGRSVVALNLGGLIYLFLGLAIFAGNAVNYFKQLTRKHDLIVATMLVVPFHLYYFNFLLLNFEQSLYPIAFAFMSAGVFLADFKKSNPTNLLLLGLLGIITASAYTPALALTGLIVFYLLTKSKKQPATVALALAGITIVAISFAFLRTDIHFFSGAQTNQQLVADLKFALQALFYPIKSNELFSIYLQPFFVITLLASLSLKMGKRAFVIGIWTVGVILFSVIAEGYGFPSPQYRLQRMTLVIPLLMTAVLVFLAKFKQKNDIVAIAVALVLIASGFYYHYYFSEKLQVLGAAPKIAQIEQLQQITTKQQPEKIYVGSKLSINLQATIFDSANYFFPGTPILPVEDICLEQVSGNNLFLTSTSFSPGQCQSYTFQLEDTYTSETIIGEKYNIYSFH